MTQRHDSTRRQAGPHQLRLAYEPPPLSPVRRRSRAQRQLVNALHQRAGRADEVLARLRQGPASTSDLARVGGIRFSARLFELRARGAVILRVDHAGYSVYILESEPGA